MIGWSSCFCLKTGTEGSWNPTESERKVTCLPKVPVTLENPVLVSDPFMTPKLASKLKDWQDIFKICWTGHQVMKMKQGFHTCFFELPFACRIRSSCNRSQAVARQLKESSLQVAFVQGGQLRCFPGELLALLAARDGRASNFLKAIEQSSIMKLLSWDELHPSFESFVCWWRSSLLSLNELYQFLRPLFRAELVALKLQSFAERMQVTCGQVWPSFCYLGSHAVVFALGRDDDLFAILVGPYDDQEHWMLCSWPLTETIDVWAGALLPSLREERHLQANLSSSRWRCFSYLKHCKQLGFDAFATQRPEGKWRGWSRSGCFFDTVECGCPPAFWAKSCATAVWRRMQSNVKIYWRPNSGMEVGKERSLVGEIQHSAFNKTLKRRTKEAGRPLDWTQGCWSSASFSSAVYADKKETLRAIFGFDDVVNDHVVQHQSSQSFHSWLTLAGRSRVKLWLRVHINTLSPQVSSKFVPFAFNFPISHAWARARPGRRLVSEWNAFSTVARLVGLDP